MERGPGPDLHFGQIFYLELQTNGKEQKGDTHIGKEMHDLIGAHPKGGVKKKTRAQKANQWRQAEQPGQVTADKGGAKD